jgi:RES domain-containing protein
MKLGRVGPKTPFFRAFTPKWAYAPESGDGAALVGGRFNRPGLKARYLAESSDAALREYQQTSSLLPPATVASFLVSAEPVVDFTGGYLESEWSEIWQEAYCSWRDLAYVQKVDPPSWIIGDIVVASGAAGLLYRSALDHRSVCLVLYPDNSRAFSAPVHDPYAALPADQSSWPKSRS